MDKVLGQLEHRTFDNVREGVIRIECIECTSVNVFSMTSPLMEAWEAGLAARARATAPPNERPNTTMVLGLISG